MRQTRNFDDSVLRQTLTDPTYLVELGFDPPLYLSTGQSVQWDGHHWEQAPLSVSTITSDATGSQSISLSIGNQDRAYGALVLSQRAKDRYVKCWIAYAAGGDPVLFADGIMDGASVGEEVQIGVIGRSTSYGSVPRIICAPPLMNHLPPSGTVIRFGTVRYTINSR